jgi:hypothetical protein
MRVCVYLCTLTSPSAYAGIVSMGVRIMYRRKYQYAHKCTVTLYACAYKPASCQRVMRISRIDREGDNKKWNIRESGIESESEPYFICPVVYAPGIGDDLDPNS